MGDAPLPDALANLIEDEFAQARTAYDTGLVRIADEAREAEAVFRSCLCRFGPQN